MFVFVNKHKFVQVLKIYTHLSKRYKPFVTVIIYFWKQDDYTLEMYSVLKYR